MGAYNLFKNWIKNKVIFLPGETFHGLGTRREHHSNQMSYFRLFLVENSRHSETVFFRRKISFLSWHASKSCVTTKPYADTKCHANEVKDTNFVIDEIGKHSRTDCTNGHCHPVTPATPRIMVGMDVAFPCSTRNALRHSQNIHRSVPKTNVVVALGALEVTPQILALVWRGLRILLTTGSD